MKAFITGIAGFAGLYLAEHLLDCGDAVAGSTLSGHWNGLTHVPDRLRSAVTPLGWDIGQPLSPQNQAWLQHFAPEVIYHLAAISKAEDCGPADEPTPLAMTVNVEGTQHVLDLAASLERPARVVFVSSSYVYEVSGPHDQLCAEEHAIAPRSGYGRTKLLAEQAVLNWLAEAPAHDGVIARAFQHAGPRQLPRFMLAEWCQQFAAGVSPVVIQNSQASLDLSDVRDVVRAYRLLAERGRRGEAYNVGSGVAVTSGAIFERLRQLADPSRPFEIRCQEPRYTPLADLRKTAAATGWQPQIPLEQTIRDTYAWFAA